MVNNALSRLNLECRDMVELNQVAAEVVNFGSAVDIWLFKGEMGAGKTTLIKSICENLQVEDQVSSPTYSLVNEYLTLDGQTIYHFDFYRINDEQEAADIGLSEYLYSGDLCLIEWPSKIINLLPEDKFMEVFIESQQNNLRYIELIKHV